ncbi:MAG TPA: S8/S53 family peptidase, partial [Caldilineaceae bacterium]|nr:S8/S53 family peptidase [Caldilineaceae bacterium]
AIESGQFVFADRNYVTSGWHGVGCTKVGALTHSVGNGPFGDPKLTAAATEAEFMGQWAFDVLTGGAPLTDLLKSDAGQGVVVGVFDSAPVGFAAAALPFTLAFTDVLNQAEVVKPAAAPPADHLANQHGIFVSSLINAIAPGSEIHLYRTLDDHGCGTLQALEVALINFLQLGSGGKPMVVNLSLGIHVPQTAGEQWEEIFSLLLPTLDAYYSGVVVVAANGNDSDQSLVFRPLRPAIYDYVLGVAATTPSGSRACYSNQGQSYLSGSTIYYYDIAAPGGDAGPAEVDGENHPCAPLVAQCPDQGDCPFGLLGRIEISGQPEKFAYWSGTSFATPLVSGVAAVCLAQASSPMSPSQVINLLRTAAVPVFQADLQSGILRLPSPCLPS